MSENDEWYERCEYCSFEYNAETSVGKKEYRKHLQDRHMDQILDNIVYG
ncbi:MAG: hypothetical protein KAS66_08360 [Candidatus Omnitrophica bacterium]|nr:hypothetical protein [Candidatus Omnitrophota bacterium]